MEEFDDTLLELREEFVKRSQVPDTLRRVGYALKHSQEPVLTLHPNSLFTDGEDHGYEVTITFNLYHSEEDILEAFRKDILESTIRWAQKIMHEVDNPESRRPSLKVGRGRRRATKITRLTECLQAYDLLSAGKCLSEITMALFPKEVSSISISGRAGSDVWKSAYEKTRERIKEAKLQIEAAKIGDFPR